MIESDRMSSNESTKMGVVVTQDLFFGSKITGTADQLGLHVKLAGTVDGGVEQASQETVRLLLLDLAMPGLSVADLIASLSEEHRPTVVAHVNTVRLDEAREAGCDEVLPRSRFTATLPEILTRSLAE